MVDVMDCSTQDALVMTMEEWVQYYNDPTKERLLNVITLEFSKTKLDKQVMAPKVVRQIDWIDNAWPAAIKQKQKATETDSSMLTSTWRSSSDAKRAAKLLTDVACACTRVTAKRQTPAQVLPKLEAAEEIATKQRGSSSAAGWLGM